MKARMSSISRFMSRSLSEKPTRMKRPVGCRATLYASSGNSLYSSNTLVTNQTESRKRLRLCVYCHLSSVYINNTEHRA